MERLVYHDEDFNSNSAGSLVLCVCVWPQSLLQNIK